MKKLLVASVTAMLMCSAVLATRPATADTDASRTHADPTGRAVTQADRGARLHGTFMIGDSTTYRIAPDLQRLMPDWHLDHKRGRSIRALPSLIDAYLRRNPRPANFVMALGTNRCHDPDWSQARLRRAIAKLPARTNVFLVMVVRAGSFQTDKDAELQNYNRYSRNLARVRPHTYIVDWRRAVLNDPTLDPVTGVSSLVEDGTHETGGPFGRRRGPGVRTYIDLVVSKWRQVNPTSS